MNNCLIEDVSEFSIRTKNALKLIDIKTTFQLGQLSIEDLTFIYMIGKKGRNEIINYCKKNAIHFNNTSYLKTDSRIFPILFK